MSQRFFIVLNETLGPLGRLVLKDGSFSSDVSKILRFKKLKNVERFLLATCEKIPDSRKTLMILFLLAIKRKISLKELKKIYENVDQVYETLKKKVAIREEVDFFAFLKISRTFLCSRYDQEVTEKFLKVCEKMLFGMGAEIMVPKPYFVIVDQIFEGFRGTVVRGQCRFNFSSFYSGGIAIVKKLDPMRVGYEGTLDDIYSQTRFSLNQLKSDLKALDIKILVSENSQDWIKDACIQSKVAFFEVNHH